MSLARGGRRTYNPHMRVSSAAPTQSPAHRLLRALAMTMMACISAPSIVDAVADAAHGAYSSSSAPTIGWSQSLITVALAPGESGFRRVTMAASATGDIRVHFSDGLTQFLRVTPSFSETGSIALELTFMVPASADLSARTGLVWMTRNGASFGSPLKILLKIQAQSLPPMPGPEGDRTLEGIDADGDGVRDDLEHYIAQALSSGPVGVHARRYVSLLQDRLMSASDPVLTRSRTLRTFWAFECLAEAAEVDVPTRRRIRATLLGRTLNTMQRSRAYLRSELHLSGMWIGRQDYMTAPCELN